MKPKANAPHEVRILPQIDKACGFDIHKDKIVLFISDKEGKGQQMIEKKTFTEDLYCIRDLLLNQEVKHCVMESTGVYWLSLYDILSTASIEVTVVNPQQVKQIPKRKTDRRDARWLCTLLLNGLVRPSFIPPACQREIRDLCRYRGKRIHELNRIANWMVKELEKSNIKIRSVLSSITSKTGISLVRLLAAGERDVEKLKAVCHKRIRAKGEVLDKALQGNLTEHGRNMLTLHLEDYDYVQNRINLLNKQIALLVSEKYGALIEPLQSISGIAETAVQIIVSEIGDDMSKFPTADHLTAWCGVAPGNHESAGKRKDTGVKKGNKFLKTAMVAAAWAAVKMKNSYWRFLFEHLKKRMKSIKAIVVIARRLLKVVYKHIQSKTLYEEKGWEQFFELQQKRGLSNKLRPAVI
jgi:transposase